MKLLYRVSYISILPRNPTIATHHDSLIRVHDAPSHMLEDLSPQNSTPHTPRHHPSSFCLISSQHNPPTSTSSLPQCCCRQIHSQKFVPSPSQTLPILTQYPFPPPQAHLLPNSLPHPHKNLPATSLRPPRLPQRPS